MKKPRLTPEQCRWFDRVHRTVCRYDLRGLSLVQAFTDIFDGDLYEYEVLPLVQAGLLQRIPAGEGRGLHCRLLGSRWFVHLTPRAIQVFWPDRAVPA